MLEAAAGARRRLVLDVRGAVQGVGFRPFVYRLAQTLGMAGWIANDPEGVRIEAEADSQTLARFLERLHAELPPRAAIHELRGTWHEPLGREQRFEIRTSADDGPRRALVLPDLAPCDDCLRELFDPADRRHAYPFTNCTNCGPRFSIVRALPYDRPNTTMAGFALCARCAAEYDDPRDRRFHAQPNACPRCGPTIALWDPEGRPLAASPAEAVGTAVRALRQGRIVAVKGVGGFHLMTDARNADAVERLRRRKRRPTKPLALMVRDVAAARALCDVPPAAAALLAAPEAPIVLLAKRRGAAVAEAVAPGNLTLGVMLPPSPLHHLLARAADAPLVATSGNLSEEPICTESREALQRLHEIADVFLVHDRPIERHVDDSVARVLHGAPRLLRRARGYAPLPVRLASPVPAILAVGAHLKNAVALGVGRQVFLSQHIGDLETPEALAAFERVISDFLRLYAACPVAVAHDLHPDYASTRWTERMPAALEGAARIAVQHHHAHLAACLAENGAVGPALGVVWDGTGYGSDGSIWGGEFLVGDAGGYERLATLWPFRLPGGDAAVREPRRTALALLHAALGPQALEHVALPPVAATPAAERRLLHPMLAHGTSSPWTSSVGRLFDGIAALLGLAQANRFEGEAAMQLEFAAEAAEAGAYPLPLVEPAEGGPVRLDWRPMLRQLLRERERGVHTARLAARFHNALVDAIRAVARRAGQPRVALCGGAFQNRILVERAARALEDDGFEVLLHSAVPPNDGGIALGQVAIAAARLAAGAV